MGVMQINKDNFLIYHTVNSSAKNPFFKKKIKKTSGAHIKIRK